MAKDYYKILGVEKNASSDEVKKAFKKQAMQHHPDRPGGNEAKFKELNEAYQVLSDSDKRQKFDQFGSDFEQQGGFPGGGGSPFGAGGFDFNFGGQEMGDIFGDLFGSRGGGQRRQRQARGRDIQVDVELDFKEAVFGIEREISLRKQTTCDVCNGAGAEPGSKLETCATCAGQGQVTQNQRTFLGNVQSVVTCPACQGQGKQPSMKCKHCGGQGSLQKNASIKVKIPAGIDDGQSIRLTGHGEAAPHGGASGDLYVQAHVRPSKIFKRDGFNVYVDEGISFSKAVLGGTIMAETVDGKVEIRIPPGTESGQLIRLREKGIPNVNGHGRGDHYARVKITVPKKVDKQTRKLLEELEVK